jgi:protein-disulfide isomerase
MIRTCSFLAIALFATSVFAQDATNKTESSAVSNAKPSPAIDALTPSPAEEAKPFVYIPKPSDVVYGKDNAPVVMVEYASLSCPHCAHFYTDALPDLTKKYIDTGKVKLVYRNYPLNDPALKAAELVQCAPADQRHTFIKVLFTTQQKWAYDNNYRDSLGNIAALGGIDRESFETCMRNKKLEKSIGAVEMEAENDYKIHSTPSFFINGALHNGPHDAPSLSKDIDAALAKAGQK